MSATDFRGDGGREAAVTPDAPVCGDRAGSWGGIDRHKRAGQRRCDTCRRFASDYSREWYRVARSIEAFRARHNAIVAESHRRGRASAEARAADNARRRARKREQLQRDSYDRRHGVDAVVVQRLIAGEPVPHNRAEKFEAMRQLLTSGLPLSAAAQRLGINGQYARKYAELIERGDVA